MKRRADTVSPSGVSWESRDTQWVIALGDIAKKHPEALVQRLPLLLSLIPGRSGKDALQAITVIQENCKYYNYEIYQAYLAAQKGNSPASQTNWRSPHHNQPSYL